MKLVSKIVIACALVEVVAFSTFAFDFLGLFDRFRDESKPKLGAIVRLHESESGRFFCSGTVVASNTIVTAAHCVLTYIDAGPFGQQVILRKGISVRTEDGKDLGIYAETAGAEPRSDQALLHGDFKDFDIKKLETDPAKIYKTFTNPDSRIQMCGYAYGGRLYCLLTQYKANYFFQMEMTGQIYPGTSGGPVIDLGTGKVIGVITAMKDDSSILSPTTNIYNNLNVINDDRK